MQETVREQRRREAHLESVCFGDVGGAAAALLAAPHDRWVGRVRGRGTHHREKKVKRENGKTNTKQKNAEKMIAVCARRFG